MKRQGERALYCVAIALWLAGCATTEEGATKHANGYGTPVPSPINKPALVNGGRIVQRVAVQ